MDDREGNLSKLRDQIEASTAAVDQGGEDIRALANTAVEQHHAMQRAEREKEAVGKLRPQDRLRAQIRNAVNEAKIKGPPKPKDYVPEMGPPSTWSAQAKQEWENLPQSVRLANLRDQSRFNAGMEPVAEIAKVYQARHPHSKASREMTPAQILNSAYEWEAALTGPNGAVAAAHLIAGAGIDANAVFQVLQQAAQQGQYSPPQQQYPQQSNDQPDPQILQTLTEFAKDHPHLERVRYSMGSILLEALHKGKDMSLEEAYYQALRRDPEFSRQDESRRAAGSVSSSRGRAPSVASEPLERSKGIRSSIKNAVAEVRHREGRI